MIIVLPFQVVKSWQSQITPGLRRWLEKLKHAKSNLLHEKFQFTGEGNEQRVMRHKNYQWQKLSKATLIHTELNIFTSKVQSPSLIHDDSNIINGISNINGDLLAISKTILVSLLIFI